MSTASPVSIHSDVNSFTAHAYLHELPDKGSKHVYSIIRVNGVISVIIYDDGGTDYIGAGVSAVPAGHRACDEAETLGLEGHIAKEFVTYHIVSALIKLSGGSVSAERFGSEQTQRLKP